MEGMVKNFYKGGNNQSLTQDKMKEIRLALTKKVQQISSISVFVPSWQNCNFKCFTQAARSSSEP